MSIAALITWLVTALGGLYLLATWLKRGGAAQQRTKQTRFPAPLIFGHFLLAGGGLVVWIIYLFADSEALAWTAFIILLPVAMLGFTMLARWIPLYRARTASVAAASDPSAASGAAGAPTEQVAPAERDFPVAAVAAHGLFAATTLVLVFLAALD